MPRPPTPTAFWQCCLVGESYRMEALCGGRGGVWIETGTLRCATACLGPNLEERAIQDTATRPHQLHASAFPCWRNELCLQHPLPAAIRRGALSV